MQNIVSTLKDGGKVEIAITSEEMSIDELRALARGIFGKNVKTFNGLRVKKVYLTFAHDLGYDFRYDIATSLVESGTKFGVNIGSSADRYFKTLTNLTVGLESIEGRVNIFIELSQGSQFVKKEEFDVIDEIIEDVVAHVFSKIESVR